MAHDQRPLQRPPVNSDLPQISAALASNFGNELAAESITALGSEGATSLTAGQINNAEPSVLLASLGILSNASDWNQGQAAAIVQALVSSGMLQV